jgi:hypothetical protein
VARLLLVLVAVVGVANSLASSRSEPPLLIDSHPAPAPITSLDQSS